jgi:hypothetical protein
MSGGNRRELEEFLLFAKVTLPEAGSLRGFGVGAWNFSGAWMLVFGALPPDYRSISFTFSESRVGG